ncbi:MAG TPA: lipopolysaccharide biosynthesis protein [Acidimicrobiales bacterium]
MTAGVTRARFTALAERNPLPDGTLTVGGGLVVNGIMSYVFLGIAARTLGVDAFGPLSVLWALIYLVGPGFFLPLEQEVSRSLANRWARGVGVGPLVKQAGLLGTALIGALVLTTLIAAPLLLDHLFDDQALILIGFVLAILGYSAVHLARGTLAGLGRFRGYALFFVYENSLRVAAAIVLALLGVETAGPYAVAVGLAPGVAIALALLGEHDLASDGPPAPWGELGAALGSLLAASVLTAFLLYAGVLAVELLADESESDKAGVFLAGLAVSRVPVFLFQAVQAALLPKLSALAGAGRFHEFRDRLRRLLSAVGVIGVAGVAGAALLGPFLIDILFGDDFALTRLDLGLLALSSAAFMLAVALGQALIALEGQSRVAFGWLIGVLAFLGITAMGDDLFLRVEAGLAAGSAVAAVVIGGLARHRLHGKLRTHPHTLTTIDRETEIEA